MSTDLSTDQPLAVYTDTDDLDPAPGIALLEANGFRVEHLGTTDQDAIIKGAQGAKALLVGYAEVTEEMLAALPDLEIVALASSGVDNVDLDAARRHGVSVANLPALAAEEVAGHAIALALALLRELPFFGAATGEADWLSRPTYAPVRLSQTTLGVIGLGHIGSIAAQQGGALFGEVLGYDPYLPDTLATTARLEAIGVRRVDLPELLASSGVVTLHLPLTESTHHLIDAEALAAMPVGSTLVNVSRGGLVDSEALAAAIDSGHLRGAGIDVLDTEPAPLDHPLVGHPRVLLTPHVAYLSDHTLREYIRVQAQNVVSFADQGAADHVVVPAPDFLTS